VAVIYLSSVDGSDADDGSTWALAKATLAASLTAAGAGGTVYVDNAHAETQATGITLTSPGTAASIVRVVCVDRTGNPEPPTTRATTGTVSCTGANNDISLNGTMYVYGLTFNWIRNGLVNNDTTNAAQVYEACGFNCGTGALSSALLLLNNSATRAKQVTLRNCTQTFNHVSQGVRVADRAVLEGGSIALTGTVPTTLWSNVSNTVGGDVLAQGVNCSAFGSGKNLINLAGETELTFSLVDCKLGASVAITTGSIPGQAAIQVAVINCDSADTNYRFHRQNYQATETQETVIVKTGGASDGTTPFSRKVVSTANASLLFPYQAMWLERWNETTGSSVTVTVGTVTDNVTLTDAEAWLEVEYLGTAGFPLGVFTSDRVSDPIFGTPANQATDTDAWTTTGLGTPVKQKLSVTFTPQEKGIIRARVVVAKASTTVYYDPLLQVA